MPANTSITTGDEGKGSNVPQVSWQRTYDNTTGVYYYNKKIPENGPWKGSKSQCIVIAAIFNTEASPTVDFSNMSPSLVGHAYVRFIETLLGTLNGTDRLPMVTPLPLVTKGNLSSPQFYPANKDAGAVLQALDRSLALMGALEHTSLSETALEVFNATVKCLHRVGQVSLPYIDFHLVNKFCSHAYEESIAIARRAGGPKWDAEGNSLSKWAKTIKKKAPWSNPEHNLGLNWRFKYGLGWNYNRATNTWTPPTEGADIVYVPQRGVWVLTRDPTYRASYLSLSDRETTPPEIIEYDSEQASRPKKKIIPKFSSPSVSTAYNTAASAFEGIERNIDTYRIYATVNGKRIVLTDVFMDRSSMPEGVQPGDYIQTTLQKLSTPTSAQVLPKPV